MRALCWILSASVLVAIAFFLPEANGPIWPSLTAAAGVVGAFFLGLIAHAFRNGQSASEIALAVGTLTLFGVLALYVGLRSYDRVRWKRSFLTETVRATVDLGQMDRYLTIPLLKTLKGYLSRPRASLKTHFLQRQEDLLRSEGNLQADSALARFVPEGLGEEGSPRLYYHSTREDGKVVLVGCSRHGNGEDPEFVNYDGSKGNMQYRAILTPSGLRYAREN